MYSRLTDVPIETVVTSDSTDPVQPLENLAAVEAAMHRYIQAQIRLEAKIAQRDGLITPIQARFAPAISKAEADIAVYSVQIEQYCRTHPEVFPEGKKSINLHWGTMGLRDSPAPPLVPISDKWTAERIRAKIIELWGKRKFFHDPKPPSLDLAKLKKLPDDELKQVGLQRDLTPAFVLELNRTAAADEVAVAVEAA